jgi:hypothetical protein
VKAAVIGRRAVGDPTIHQRPGAGHAPPVVGPTRGRRDQMRLKMSVPLVPPKPKELLSA